MLKQKLFQLEVKPAQWHFVHHESHMKSPWTEPEAPWWEVWSRILSWEVGELDNLSGVLNVERLAEVGRQICYMLMVFAVGITKSLCTFCWRILKTTGYFTISLLELLRDKVDSTGNQWFTRLQGLDHDPPLVEILELQVWDESVIYYQ
jgi:hypothetical protein